jgi:hypothetical protein
MEFGKPEWSSASAAGGKQALNGEVSLLEWAIEHEEWEMAALCLLLGLIQSLRRVPPEVVDAMIDEMAGLELEDEPHAHRRRDRRGRRGRRR